MTMLPRKLTARSVLRSRARGRASTHGLGALGLSLALLACSDSDAPEDDSTACQSGAASPCSCSDGTVGTLVCSGGQATGCSCQEPAVVDASTSPGAPTADSGTPPGADAGTSSHQDASTPVVDAAGSGDPGATGCLQSGSGDFSQAGPYQVATEDVTLPDLGSYTIFYPQTMEAACPHPVVGWGNGTTVTGSRVYAHFQQRAASWGVIVIAAHDPNAGSKEFIGGGIDYMLAQGKTQGSKFFGKISEKAGASGHSQGGFAATTASRHPNVHAVVSVQGGGIPDAKVAFMCQTGVDDFVRPQCTASYNRAAGPRFLADHNDADHTGTPTTLGARTPAGQEYVRLYTAWFRCFLAGDDAACSLFRGGTSAPVCSQSSWATCDGEDI